MRMPGIELDDFRKLRTINKLYNNLNPIQAGHLHSIRWLFLDDGETARRTGRSDLMARMFIEKALLNLETPIHVFDHFMPSSQQTQTHMLAAIHHVWYELSASWKEAEYYEMVFSMNGDTFFKICKNNDVKKPSKKVSKKKKKVK